MGVYAGPDVSESGLVLALDGANYKSFKGEATTNEIVSVTWAGDGSNQASFVKETVLITDENLKYNGYETYLWSPGTSNDCYLNGADLSTGRTSTVWTFSCYIKRQDGAPITSLSVYMYYPSSDGSATGTIQDVGNGWYRVSRTRTGTNNYLSLIGFTGFVTGYKYYLSGAQLEKKSYPTTVVATNTTRGTTVATGGGWADLTGNGNHGELVNGVRESSDNLGALVFGGDNEYIDLGSDIVFKSSGGWTVESWVKYDVIPTTYNNVTSPANFIGSETITHNSWYWSVFESKLALWNRSPGVWKYGSTILQANTWYNAVLVCYDSGTSYQMYLNGIPEGGDHTTYSWNASYSGLNIRYIGRGNSSNVRLVNGKISTTKVYDRALTASEVQQNFNANRSRFGI